MVDEVEFGGWPGMFVIFRGASYYWAVAFGCGCVSQATIMIGRITPLLRSPLLRSPLLNPLVLKIAKNNRHAIPSAQRFDPFNDPNLLRNKR
jgi:hypothetical protein